MANILLKIVRDAEELRKWTEENSDMAAAMDEARTEDEQRTLTKLMAEQKAAELRRIAETAPEFLISCGVGERAVKEFQKGLKPTVAREVVANFLASDKMLLILEGATGSGKSIAAAEALLLIRRPDVKVSARFVSADWLARLSYFDLKSYEGLCALDLLVIDDIGEEQASSTFAATLDGLLNQRMWHERRTIITTNLTASAFKARYAPDGSRLASRLAQDSMVVGAGKVDFRRNPIR